MNLRDPRGNEIIDERGFSDDQVHEMRDRAESARQHLTSQIEDADGLIASMNTGAKLTASQRRLRLRIALANGMGFNVNRVAQAHVSDFRTATRKTYDTIGLPGSGMTIVHASRAHEMAAASGITLKGDLGRRAFAVTAYPEKPIGKMMFVNNNSFGSIGQLSGVNDVIHEANHIATLRSDDFRLERKNPNKKAHDIELYGWLGLWRAQNSDQIPNDYPNDYWTCMQGAC